MGDSVYTDHRDPSTQDNLIPELYRKEYGRMVAVLCSRFGTGFIDTAADIVSDTFLTAAETWGMKGIPANPVAWLYTVARNNALNHFKHARVFQKKVRSELSKRNEQAQNANLGTDTDFDLSPGNITDSQLQLLFTVCHPAIPVESQLSLALRVLCGFTIDEIASALLTSKGTINKRLFRARERLREENIEMTQLSGKEIGERLDTVMATIYLLFNEGYYSASPDKVLRKDFCLEAMRLAWLLAESPGVAGPRVYALLALMCFHASRFEARSGPEGRPVPYERQDRGLWDQELIDRGNEFLVKAVSEDGPSKYHLEAAIAWWHTQPADDLKKWEQVLLLYNQLLVLQYSPVAALNRAYAYFRVYGKEPAIAEAEKLQLEGNLFYHSLLGDLYTGIDDKRALDHFEKALSLSGTPGEKSVMEERITALSFHD